MGWLVDVLTFIAFLFSTLVFAIDPEEEQRIRNLYENNYQMMSEHYGGIIELLGVTPCYEYINPRDTEYRSVLKLIWHFEGNSGVPITLDDVHFFISPAIIVCHIEENSSSSFSFSLMISSINNDGMKFMKLVGKTEHVGYTIRDVLLIRSLRRNFKEEPSETAQTIALYSDIAEDHNRIIKFCESKYRLEDTDFEVWSGGLVSGDFLLRLTENENVNIPGVLECDIVYGNNNAEVILYVLDYLSILYRVYEAHDIDGKKAYALEKHLGDD